MRVPVPPTRRDDSDETRLDRLLMRRRNNLDFIRFVAALLVILSHAFPLSGGPAFEAREPYVLFTKGQATFGGLGVAIFFVISGFLIAASFQRSRSWATYLWARILRIYPALAVVVLSSVVVLGPLVTRLSGRDYWTHPQTWGYLRVLLMTKMSYFLPGVFEANPFPSAVNGSLWTLPFEFLFYLMVLALGVLGLLRARVVIVMYGANLVLRAFFVEAYPELGWSHPALDVVSSFWRSLPIAAGSLLLLYFSAGMVAFFLRDRLKLGRIAVLASIATFIPVIAFGEGYSTWFATGGAILLLRLAVLPIPGLPEFGRYGDVSYGLYIYAFPVQQTLMHFGLAEGAWWRNFLMATPITLLLAILSWHLVEKHALKLKRYRFWTWTSSFRRARGGI